MLDLGKYPRFKGDFKLMKQAVFLEVEWRRAYPKVNLEEQAGWAHAYIVSNGKKYKNMARYLNNWFKRCQQWADHTIPVPIFGQPPKYVEQKPEGEIMTGDDFTEMRRMI